MNSCHEDKNASANLYWFTTSSNSIIEKLAENAGMSVKQEIEALRQEGYQKILKYGVAFYKKECMVEMGE